MGASVSQMHAPMLTARRHRRVVAAALTFALGTAAVVVTRSHALAEDEDPGPPAAEQAQATVDWVDGYEAGRLRAQESDQLMLVYLHRDRPPCPSCIRLEREVFAAKGSDVLNSRYVPVRLTGGADLDEPTREFMARYGLGSYPSLLVMNAEGHVVIAQPGDSLLQLQISLMKAEILEEDFDRLREQSESAARQETAKRLRRRMAWEESLATYRALRTDGAAGADGTAGAAGHRAILYLEDRIARIAIERPVPVADGNIAGSSDAAAHFSRLAAQAKRRGERGAHAAYRAAAGRAALVAGVEAGAETLASVRKNYADTYAASRLELRAARAALASGDPQKAKTLLTRILDVFPDADHAAQAAQLFDECQLRLAAKAKAKRAR